MHDTLPTEQKIIINRLHRIVGQVQGIERMVKEDQDCLAIMHQVMAVRSALSTVATKIVSLSTCKHLSEKEKAQVQQIIQSVLKLQ